MQEDKDGTIFIVDISGYSRFVSAISNESGGLIISNLLEGIIDANFLSFNISEIEGDAILFYRHGPVDRVSSILTQFERMLNAFDQRVRSYQKNYPQVAKLSIKLVVHFGTIGRLSVGCYSKIFGRSVVEAHRLLKNNIDSDTYALITDDFLKQQYESDTDLQSAHACEIYDVGNLCYTYFAFPRKNSDPSNELPVLHNQDLPTYTQNLLLN